MEADLISSCHSRLNFQIQRSQLAFGQSYPESWIKAGFPAFSLTMVASTVLYPFLFFMNMNTAARSNSVTTATNEKQDVLTFMAPHYHQLYYLALLMSAATEVVFVPIP